MVNRLSPLRFVVAFGVVSMLADFSYEGARSIVGPFLATLGANATAVGLITGLGEAVASVLRLGTGRLSDRTGRHWALSVAGYLITLVSVPLLGAAQGVWQAATLVVAERFGKAVRTPARDTMLAQASAEMGRGWAFGLHEMLDQSGALLGPLLVAAMVAISGYRLGFAVLAIPGALATLALVWLRQAVPVPAAYESHKSAPAPPAQPPGRGGSTSTRFEPVFWLYAAFTALSLLGFATFGVLSYHLQVRGMMAPPLIPVLYALAMGSAALSSLASGRVYDALGLRGLGGLPVLTAIVPFLSFSVNATLVWVGAALWGAVLGVHESTMRAAIADLVPMQTRGLGYGTFTAVYGLAWLVGSALIGALYGVSTSAIAWFVVGTQIAAAVAFVPLAMSHGARRV